MPRTLSLAARHLASSCIAIVVSCLVLVAAAWLLTLERIRHERVEALAGAQRHNANLAQAFEEHTIRTLTGLDHMVRFIRAQYLRMHLTERQLLEESGLDIDVLSAAGLVDAQGEIVLYAGGTNGGNVADRDYFQYHRRHADGGLRITGPAITRATQRPAIFLTRRIDLPEGGFGGIALVGVDPGYFASFYANVDLGRDGMVLLATRDGTVLARRAAQSVASGYTIRDSTLFARLAESPEGGFVSRGAYDGTPRLVSYRAVRGFPLVVAVGASQEEVLAPVAARARTHRLTATLATIVVVLFGALLLGFRKRQERALAEVLRGEARYRQTFDQAPVGVSHAALDGRFLRVNRKLCEMLGYAPEELLERSWRDVVHPDDIATVERLVAKPGYAAPEVDKRYVRKDGTIAWGAATLAPVRDKDGRVEYIVTMLQDVTQRKQAEAKLAHQAHYDALTGLPNRALCFDRLAQALGQAGRKGWGAGLLFLDLDRFKRVNDTLGHAGGDALLCETARRLAACVRAGDTVARVGGDEFAIVLSELARPHDAASLAQQILDAMAKPLAVEGSEIFVTTSLGIATYPADGATAEALIRNADAAMFRAKEVGRNNYQFYTAALNGRSEEKLRLETDLRRALERREFLLHYQPKMSLLTGRVTGVEALLRWQRAGNGLVSPGDFVPLLEESGLIVPVGDWVLDAACGQLAAWREAGRDPVPIAVNLSAKQFLHHDIAGAIERALARHGIAASLLQVEITETDAMADPQHAAEVLRRLKQSGVGVAIDDFGTGYSSLGYLKRFPADALKLDRSFVTGLPDDADDVSIALAVIGMAHSLGLRVVAEGVEQPVQRDFLAAHGCDEMQGFLFSPALPAVECAALLPARAGASMALAT